MEHYLGEKLKFLREQRNWSQKDLAARLNKATSTISGYESDAHTIPLDVSISSASLFGVSLDEFAGLEKPEYLSLEGLTPKQCEILKQLKNEYLTASQRGNDFSQVQMNILHDIIKSFGAKE